MRHNQLDRELTLILLLASGHDYTVRQLCEKLGISVRSLYYYLEFFRDYGFIVEKRGQTYRLDKDSPFFRKLFKSVHFTEDEAVMMRRVLARTGDNSPQLRHLREKLDRLYDFEILDDVDISRRDGENISVLYEAIKSHNKVVIHRYSSPHSNTRTSRIVEPFMFMNGNNEVRAYEITTRMNKTFKVARMEAVEMLMDPWEHEHLHRRIYTDIFMFSSEEQHVVTLRLNLLAYNLISEEYPKTRDFIEPDGFEHWILRLPVCSYVGITRFVLGLYDNIEVLGDDGFVDYVSARIEAMAQKIRHSIG